MCDCSMRKGGNVYKKDSRFTDLLPGKCLCDPPGEAVSRRILLWLTVSSVG